MGKTAGELIRANPDTGTFRVAMSLNGKSVCRYIYRCYFLTCIVLYTSTSSGSRKIRNRPGTTASCRRVPGRLARIVITDFVEHRVRSRKPRSAVVDKTADSNITEHLFSFRSRIGMIYFGWLVVYHNYLGIKRSLSGSISYLDIDSNSDALVFICKRAHIKRFRTENRIVGNSCVSINSSAFKKLFFRGCTRNLYFYRSNTVSIGSTNPQNKFSVRSAKGHVRNEFLRFAEVCSSGTVDMYLWHLGRARYVYGEFPWRICEFRCGYRVPFEFRRQNVFSVTSFKSLERSSFCIRNPEVQLFCPIGLINRVGKARSAHGNRIPVSIAQMIYNLDFHRSRINQAIIVFNGSNNRLGVDRCGILWILMVKY